MNVCHDSQRTERRHQGRDHDQAAGMRLNLKRRHGQTLVQQVWCLFGSGLISKTKLGLRRRSVVIIGTIFLKSVIEFVSSGSPAKVIALPLEPSVVTSLISMFSASAVGCGFTSLRIISLVLLSRVAQPCTMGLFTSNRNSPRSPVACNKHRPLRDTDSGSANVGAGCVPGTPPRDRWQGD